MPLAGASNLALFDNKEFSEPTEENVTHLVGKLKRAEAFLLGVCKKSKEFPT